VPQLTISCWSSIFQCRIRIRRIVYSNLCRTESTRSWIILDMKLRRRQWEWDSGTAMDPLVHRQWTIASPAAQCTHQLHMIAATDQGTQYYCTDTFSPNWHRMLGGTWQCSRARHRVSTCDVRRTCCGCCFRLLLNSAASYVFCLQILSAVVSKLRHMCGCLSEWRTQWIATYGILWAKLSRRWIPVCIRQVRLRRRIKNLRQRKIRRKCGPTELFRDYMWLVVGRQVCMHTW